MGRQGVAHEPGEHERGGLMAWIRVEDSLPGHYKVRRLAASLGDAGAVGYLVQLWLWAARYKPTGDLSTCDAEEIAFACGWPPERDPAVILNALVICRFLDRTDGRLTVHDWHEYQGAIQVKAEADRERLRRKRAEERARDEASRSSDVAAATGVVARPSRDVAATIGDVARTSHVTVRNETVRNETEDKSQDISVAASAPAPPPDPSRCLEVAGGATWVAHDKLVAALAEAYPAVPVEPEFAKIRAWLTANPKKRPTVKGCGRFVNAWFERSQNDPRMRHQAGDARGQPAYRTPTAPPVDVSPDRLAAYLEPRGIRMTLPDVQ